MPQTQNPEVFGMHDNVDISRELQETKLLFNNVLLTLGRTAGSGAGRSDEQLYNIATDILNKASIILLLQQWTYLTRQV